MKRRTFKINSPSIEIDKEEVISKGSEIYEVDINSVRAILKSLHPYAQTPIRDLTGEAKKNYETVVNYVNCFYENGTYESLHEVIRSEFSDVKTLNPGTVGCYMIGCAASADTCMPTCVNSAPSPNHSPCTERVIMGTYNNGSYSFTPLNNISSPKSVVYVPYPQFNGFNQDEKASLASLNVTHCWVRGSNINKQSDFTSGYIPLTDIPERDGDIQVPYVAATRSSHTSYNLAFLLLIIIIILILLFVAWKSWY